MKVCISARQKRPATSGRYEDLLGQKRIPRDSLFRRRNKTKGSGLSKLGVAVAGGTCRCFSADVRIRVRKRACSPGMKLSAISPMVPFFRENRDVFYAASILCLGTAGRLGSRWEENPEAVPAEFEVMAP